MTEHQRKHERMQLRQAIKVVDIVNGCAAGEVVNITVEGMMLSMDQALQPGSIYQFALTLPEPIGEHKVINIGADCLWSREANQDNRYWAGFQIIDASETAEDLISELINMHGALSA